MKTISTLSYIFLRKLFFIYINLYIIIPDNIYTYSKRESGWKVRKRVDGLIENGEITLLRV